MTEEFIGQEVGIIEKYKVKSKDPVVKKLKKTYPELRIWLPNTVGTADYVPTRTNIHIDKDEEGVWRITKVDQG